MSEPVRRRALTIESEHRAEHTSALNLRGKGW
jgi:hypothetical protein